MKPIHYPHSTATKSEAMAMIDRYEKIGLAEVKQVFASSGLSLTPKKVTKPQSFSTRHVIYLVDVVEGDETFLFRSNIGYSKQPEVVLAREKLMTDLAADAGVPVNEILYVDISRKHVAFDFQIQKVVPGLDIEDHYRGTQDEYDELSIEIGEVVAKLHTVTLKGFGRFDTRASESELIGDVDSNYEYIMLDVDVELGDLAEANILSTDESAKLQQYFEQRKELMHVDEGSLLHYDIADHNMMFKDNRLTGLIDWESAVSGDPMLDIASMPTWKTHHPRLEKFLEGYLRHADKPTNFEEKMMLYRLRTLLWKTVFCLKADILNEARQQRFTDCLVNVGVRK